MNIIELLHNAYNENKDVPDAIRMEALYKVVENINYKFKVKFNQYQEVSDYLLLRGKLA